MAEAAILNLCSIEDSECKALRQRKIRASSSRLEGDIDLESTQPAHRLFGQWSRLLSAHHIWLALLPDFRKPPVSIGGLGPSTKVAK